MSADVGRLLTGLERIIRRVMRRVDFCALYPARVLSQNADGTLELAPESESLPPMSAVPYRTLPGVALTVPAGSRVLLGFEDADPARPMALLWELGTVTRLAVNGSTTRAAREGDDVAAGVTMAAWMAAVTTKLNAGTGVVPAAPSTIGAVSGGSDVVRIP
jgi:hypothetical protein